jgi:hypothetical protein
MKLLAERETNGIVVRLYWDSSRDPGEDVVVKYRDWVGGRTFCFRPPREKALHAYYHPNAYAPAGLPDAA